jgi:hypothetical protein
MFIFDKKFSLLDTFYYMYVGGKITESFIQFVTPLLWLSILSISHFKRIRVTFRFHKHYNYQILWNTL